jgi:hypothetical protein
MAAQLRSLVLQAVPATCACLRHSLALCNPRCKVSAVSDVLFQAQQARQTQTVRVNADLVVVGAFVSFCWT